MKKVQLGKTDIKITQLGMGNTDFGTKINEKTAFKILDHFYEAGGNFLDSSNNYSVWNPNGKGGECETIIGNWMKSRDNRDEIVLATKVGANPKNINDIKNPDGTMIDNWWSYGEGLSKEAINNAIKGSLKRLQTDYIDLYYAHVEDLNTPLKETLGTFNELIEKGIIRSIGCSNHRTWRLERSRHICQQNNWIEYSCIQQFHTYLRPDPAKRGIHTNNELLDYILYNPEINLIAYTPTIYGNYAKIPKDADNSVWGDFNTKELDNRLAALDQITKEKDCTRIQIIFAWLVQNAPSSVPLVTTSSIEHLDEDLESLNIKLSENDLKVLNEAKA